MAKPDPIEAAMAEGARRALTRRATELRQEAADMATTTTDAAGRSVPIVPPEARVKARTADVLDEAAVMVGHVHHE